MSSWASWRVASVSSVGAPKVLPATDKDGYLRDLDDWSPTVAEEIAQQSGIALTPAHWQIIELAQAFYRSYDLSPDMRPLAKWVRAKLGEEKGSSLHLLKLFPGSPARLVAKIAGLPRPTNCL